MTLFQGQQTADFAIKLFGILFSSFYIIFSVIVARQVKTLNSTVTLTAGSFYTVIADVQILLSIFLLFFSIFIL